MAFEYYMDAFRNFANFSGRARRSEYWYFALFNMIMMVTLIFMVEISQVFGILLGIYYLGVFIPSLSLIIRRLHDTGRSGWWLLISLIPLIGPVMMLIFLCQDSDMGTNAWGPNPKAESDNIEDHLMEQF